MISQETFDQLFGFLAEALAWRVSDTTRAMIYDRVSLHHTDDEFMVHVEKFCDRGQGTAAQFLAYLKDERRRVVAEGRPAAELPPAVAPEQLLMGADREETAWRMPCQGQIKVAKFLALRQRGYQVSFGDVALTEEDLNTIRLTRLSRLTPTAAFLEVIADRGRVKGPAGGMSSIGEVLGA